LFSQKGQKSLRLSVILLLWQLGAEEIQSL